jgi:hypothetical protein
LTDLPHLPSPPYLTQLYHPPSSPYTPYLALHWTVSVTVPKCASDVPAVPLMVTV